MLISIEIPWRNPITAFFPFADDPVAALLHSDGLGETGRWSYIAASPFCVLKTDENLTTTLDGTAIAGDPLQILQDTVSKYALHDTNSPAPFAGGAVGFLSYELGRTIEQLPRPKTGASGPVMTVGLFDVIAAFDHHTEKVWVIASGFPQQGEDARRMHAEQRAAWLSNQLTSAPDKPHRTRSSVWTADASRKDCETRIEKAISYIQAGDIFQANITHRYTAPRPESMTAWDIFRTLREKSPSPFGAFVSAAQDFRVLSASPERFLKVDTDGQVESRPIKGSRPRGKTPAADDALARELQSSTKDLAENLMIVDLMRNDLSRVCAAGSVNVPVQSGLETFPAIHHLVSVVTGQLRPEETVFDLLRACFPGGSITGAPKVRAMEVIHELEPVARGPYCGAVLWVGFNGAMDSSIVIRTLVVEGDTVVAQAGGGIVSDSDPTLEYEEAMVKVQPLLAALNPTEAA